VEDSRLSQADAHRLLGDVFCSRGSPRTSAMRFLRVSTCGPTLPRNDLSYRIGRRQPARSRRLRADQRAVYLRPGKSCSPSSSGARFSARSRCSMARNDRRSARNDRLPAAILERREVFAFLERHPKVWPKLVEMLCSRYATPISNPRIGPAAAAGATRQGAAPLRRRGEGARLRARAVLLAQSELETSAAPVARASRWQHGNAAGILQVEEGSVLLVKLAALEELARRFCSPCGAHVGRAASLSRVVEGGQRGGAPARQRHVSAKLLILACYSQSDVRTMAAFYYCSQLLEMCDGERSSFQSCWYECRSAPHASG
jgi:hypothetical protein